MGAQVNSPRYFFSVNLLKTLYFQANLIFNEKEDEEQLDVGEIRNIIDKSLAKFFFTCNISFLTSEKPYFINFVEVLIRYGHRIPNYKPPCRTTLSTTLLREIHQEVNEEKKIIINETACALQCDGWKNSVTNKKLLVFCLTNFRTPLIYLTHMDISTETEDGENLAEHIGSAIDFAESMYGAKVISTITDNDSKILCGARIAMSQNGRSKITTSCTSHSGNLLGKSIVDDEDQDIL